MCTVICACINIADVQKSIDVASVDSIHRINTSKNKYTYAYTYLHIWTYTLACAIVIFYLGILELSMVIALSKKPFMSLFY